MAIPRAMLSLSYWVVPNCSACGLHARTHNVPCLAHTLRSLRAARARAIGAVR